MTTAWVCTCTIWGAKRYSGPKLAIFKISISNFRKNFEDFSKFESPKNLSWWTVTLVKISAKSVNSTNFGSQLCIFSILKNNFKPLLFGSPRTRWPEITPNSNEFVCPKVQTKVFGHLHRNLRLDPNRPVRVYQKTTVKLFWKACIVTFQKSNICPDK